MNRNREVAPTNKRKASRPQEGSYFKVLRMKEI